jgi:prevent-host-death family protein
VVPITIGAHEFRERFGYWMEVGASGQEIVVTRRGRPSIHLAPMQPRLVSGETNGAP